jgi:hypothetical protein
VLSKYNAGLDAKDAKLDAMIVEMGAAAGGTVDSRHTLFIRF